MGNPGRDGSEKDCEADKRRGEWNCQAGLNPEGLPVTRQKILLSFFGFLVWQIIQKLR
jgi:hypothetical protein